MAIVKSGLRETRVDGDASPGSRASVSSEEDDEEVQSRSSLSGSSSEENEEGLGVSDSDSGMGSDEYDLSEFGQAETEFCQVGNESCSILIELYDLPGLKDVLSVETWNECLSEEERHALTTYLPDMDQETYIRTLRELFAGENFHFGSPLVQLFDRLKGGLCEPSVVLYRRGLKFFERHEHYHRLRRYQNSMVGSLVQIRDCWKNCRGYGIQDRLGLLNMMRSDEPLAVDGHADSETDMGSEDSRERFWNKRLKMSKYPFDGLFTGRGMDVKPMKFVKENPKGILKVAAPKGSAKKGKTEAALGQFPSLFKHGGEAKSRQAVPLSAVTLRTAGYDSGAGRKARIQMRGDADADDLEEQDYEVGLEGDWHNARQSSTAMLKSGNKQNLSKRYARHVQMQYGGEEPGSYAGLPRSLGRSRNVDQAVTMATYDGYSHGMEKKAKSSGKDWMYPTKDRTRPQHNVLKGSQFDWHDATQPGRQSNMHGDDIDHQANFDNWNMRGKKLKAGAEFRAVKGKTGSSKKLVTSKEYPAQVMNESYLGSNGRAKASKAKSKNNYARTGSMGMEHSRRIDLFPQSEETESDSSDHIEEVGDITLERKVRAIKSLHEPKKATKGAKKDRVQKEFFESIHGRELESSSMKGKQRGKAKYPSYLDAFDMLKRGQVPNPTEKLQLPKPKSYSMEKKRKGMLKPDRASAKSNYLNEYGSSFVEEQDLDGSPRFACGQMEAYTSGNGTSVAAVHTFEADHLEKAGMPLVGCSSSVKKRKGKLDSTFQNEPDFFAESSPKKQIDDSNPIKKKGKRNMDPVAGSLPVATPDPVVLETEKPDVELEMKLQKKPYTLITPTVHTGFSFSIVHLLSAIRKAMITPLMEDTSQIGSHLQADVARPLPKRGEQSNTFEVANGSELSPSNENMDIARHKNLPSLTVQEIVDQVKSNPGDPCILETQEPLQDLVRGVLKIFSSKTAPLGAKGWKPLVVYEKSNKTWSWVGPLPSSSSDNEPAEEDTSSEAWGVPHKMLVKLVDAFANWLKSGQETLRQIGSLPAPPVMAPYLDEKERFRDLRAQKSLNTINPSSDEVRSYFRKEEGLRYSVPDRAFSYTAADGKKSIVAPLRRGGGKPTSKARDHFMLKPDRPPHVTILCLVRDAAARLPGSIGTRADVCTLIRDSQYIVEDVTDAQVNQVVSGALDRLHYERDPCVQFDADRKLWVYLHREREEEDFEDDGTSSTKKWKRQRKDAEPTDMGAANDGGEDPAAGDPSARYDLNPDLNMESSPPQAGDKPELVYNDLRPNVDNVDSFTHSTPGGRNQSNPGSWDVIGLHPSRENKMLCQENSTNEDFEDEAFSRERRRGMLSANL